MSKYQIGEKVIVSTSNPGAKTKRNHSMVEKVGTIMFVGRNLRSWTWGITGIPLDAARSARFSHQLLAMSLITSLFLHSMTVVPEYTIPKVYVPKVHVMKKVLHRTKKVSHHTKKVKKIKRLKVMAVKKKIPVRYTSVQVAGYIAEALWITHEPKSWTKPLYWLAYQESRFYTHSIDGTSVRNANLAGNTEHAMGLFQVLPSTFLAHALPGYRNIWDPIDNAVAAIRYIKGRYESPYKIPELFQVSQYNGY